MDEIAAMREYKNQQLTKSDDGNFRHLSEGETTLEIAGRALVDTNGSETAEVETEDEGQPVKTSRLPSEEEQAFFEQIGSVHAFAFTEYVSRTARVRIMRTVRAKKTYRRYGLNWKEACAKWFHASNDTINAEIEALGSLGAAAHSYLTERLRVPASTLLQLPVNKVDQCLEMEDGRKIPFDGEHDDEIKAVVADLRRARTADETQKKKLKEQLDKATAELDAAKEREIANANRHRKAWEYADDDAHRLLLEWQFFFDSHVKRLSVTNTSGWSQMNHDRLVALVEYAYRELHQVGEFIRARYGIGLNAASPGERLFLQEITPNAKDLVGEYRDVHPLKRK